METSSKLNSTLFIRGILMTEVIWKDPQTGKVWKRIGKCNHCGGCCTVFCPFFRWIALKDIKAGTVLSFKDLGDNKVMKSYCTIFDTDKEVKLQCVQCRPDIRKNYPSNPLITPPLCGFKWVDEEGNEWRREKQDYRLGVLKK